MSKDKKRLRKILDLSNKIYSLREEIALNHNQEIVNIVFLIVRHMTLGFNCCEVKKINCQRGNKLKVAKEFVDEFDNFWLAKEFDIDQDIYICWGEKTDLYNTYFEDYYVH